MQMGQNSSRSIFKKLGVDQRIEKDGKCEKLENVSRCVVGPVTGTFASPLKVNCSVLSQVALTKRV